MQFQYKPLKQQSKEIRLLRFSAHGDDAAITAELSHVDLNDDLEYDCLSYTWETAVLDHCIILNGSRLPVTQNLYLALIRMRRLNPHTWLWVDAVCINQSDIEERSSQVAQMHDVYKNARRTVVWLGEAADDSDLAIAFLKDLAKSRKQFQAGEEQSSLSRQKIFSINSMKQWNALDTLLQRSWWSRVWVIQEVSVPNVLVVCGDETIDWKDVAPALELPRFSCVERDTFFQHINKSRTQIMKYTILDSFPAFMQKLPLLELMSEVWSKDATDPRDKVFALLGLASDTRKDSPRPDYKKSIEQVYKETSKDIIRRDNSLELLQYSGIHDACTNLPSWVADWRDDQCQGRLLSIPLVSWLVRNANLGPVNALRVLYGHDVDACNKTAVSVSFDDALTTLSISSIFVDQISILGRHQKLDSVEESIRESFMIATGVKDPYVTGESQSIAVSQALHAGFWYEHTSEVEEMRLRSIMCRSWDERRFFVTSHGYVGLGPSSAVVGDWICVLAGAILPFALRKVDFEYEVVGQCYLHGFMHGEAVLGEESGTSRWKQIILR